MKPGTSQFANALASVETLPLEDQTTLIDLVKKRIAAARRQEIVRDIAAARADYRRGNVKRGTATEILRELRSK